MDLKCFGADIITRQFRSLSTRRHANRLPPPPSPPPPPLSPPPLAELPAIVGAGGMAGCGTVGWRSGGCQSSRKDFRYCHRHHSRHPIRRRRAIASDGARRLCLRDTSRQTSDVPLIATMIAVSALFIDSRRSDGDSADAPQKAPASAMICRQIWRSRSLIIQAKCGTFAVTDRYIRCPCSMRKVKP